MKDYILYIIMNDDMNCRIDRYAKIIVELLGHKNCEQ